MLVSTISLQQTCNQLVLSGTDLEGQATTCLEVGERIGYEPAKDINSVGAGIKSHFWLVLNDFGRFGARRRLSAHTVRTSETAAAQ